MQHFTGTSLRTRLYILILVAFIPLSGLILHIAEKQKAKDTKSIFQKALMLTKAAAVEENQKLNATLRMLTALSDAVFTFEDNPREISGLLDIFSKQFTEEYAQFGILSPDGRLLAGAGQSETGTNYSDRSWFSACIQGKSFAMGEYGTEQISGKPVLYLALPALDAGNRVAAVAYAAVNLNWLNRSIFRRLSELPAGSRLTLLEQGKEMLQYDVDTGQWSVLKNFDPTLRRQIVSRQSGTLSAADENAVARIYAFAPLASSLKNRRVSVVLGMPESLALGASTRSFARNVALLVVSALAAMLLIWWAGDFYILRRVRNMVRISRELSGGNLDARIGKPGPRDELGYLADALNEMAESLQSRVEREKQVMATLEQSREQIRSLAAHEQEAREEERIRIAREIHDQFGQSLTVLKMDLFWLKKRLTEKISGVDEKIEGMNRIIDGSLEILHAITAQLRPVILDDFGLAAAIEWQCEEFENRSGIRCRIETGSFDPDLPKGQATAAFRIFQEALTNIVRHARAAEVTVRLGEEAGGLRLEVKDNGRGITSEEINNPRSFGLLGIRERLYPWNGRVTFDGEPGKGTCVTVWLPLGAKGDPQ